MVLVYIVIVGALTGITDAVWYRDLTSPRGLEFGDMVFRVMDTNAENRTLEERIALRVDYGDVWVSALQSKNNDGVELDFFTNDNSEGENNSILFISYIID